MPRAAVRPPDAGEVHFGGRARIHIMYRAAMRMYLVIAVLVVGCSKKSSGDECQQVADKMKPIVSEMAKNAGREFKPQDETKMVERCRTALKDGRRDPGMDCILRAADEAAVRACLETGITDYKKKAKAIEGKLMLNRMSKSLKAMFATASAFPVGNVGLTPAAPCCAQPDHKCPVNAADWNDPAWKAIEFTVDEPGLFRYTYESDGKTVTATAVGDVECDGKPVTYKLAMSVGSDGNPTSTITDSMP